MGVVGDAVVSSANLMAEGLGSETLGPSSFVCDVDSDSSAATTTTTTPPSLRTPARFVPKLRRKLEKNHFRPVPPPDLPHSARSRRYWSFATPHFVIPDKSCQHSCTTKHIQKTFLR